MTYTISLQQKTSTMNGPMTTRVVAGEVIASSRRPMVAVPADQLYYWSRRWQTDEALAVQELDRGEGRQFDCPADAIRWLLSDDG